MPAAILVLLAVGVAYAARERVAVGDRSCVFLCPGRGDDHRRPRRTGFFAAIRRLAGLVGVYDQGAGRAVGYELLADDDAVLGARAATAGELQAVLGE